MKKKLKWRFSDFQDYLYVAMSVELKYYISYRNVMFLLNMIY